MDKLLEKEGIDRDGETSIPKDLAKCNIMNIHVTTIIPSTSIGVSKLFNEQKFFENFTDDQLNRIGLDRNIPDVVIYPRERKIMMLLSDPNRVQYQNFDMLMADMTIGDLLCLAVKENIPVKRIPDRYNVRRILVSLILYQRKRSDLIEYNLLSDDDLRTIVYVIQASKDVDYSWILKRCDLEKMIDTGKFPQCNDDFLARWRRYEILKILPHNFLQSISFQLPSSELSMVPMDNYIISRLIDISENAFEMIYARDRNMDIEVLKAKYGIVVPNIWNMMDYIGLNGRFYPNVVSRVSESNEESFVVEKLMSIGTKNGQRDYLSQFSDMQIFTIVKNYVPYNSRPELIDNILTLFDSNEKIYFVSLLPQLQGKIYYGNYSYSEVFSSEMLASKLEFLSTQQYPLEDKIYILKKIRHLQTLLLSRNMMNSILASSLSRLITTYEGIPDAQPILYYFLLLPQDEIANVRKLFYQRFYYSQTRSALYLPMIKSDFVKILPKLCNINQMIPQIEDKNIYDSNDDLYQTIAYMKLFFGYAPHSIRNL